MKLLSSGRRNAIRAPTRRAGITGLLGLKGDSTIQRGKSTRAFIR